MVEIAGRRYSKREFLDRVGDVSQVGGAVASVVTEGRGEGTRIVSVRTGSGLNFTVVPSRALDIAWAEWKGLPFAFMSKAGLCGPAFYDARGDEFLRNFHAGLLTTCGLLNTGPASEDGGDSYEMHGRISNVPAYDVAVSGDWTEGDEYIISVSGKVRLSKLYRENLVLSRRIETRLGSKAVRIGDRVENEGGRPEELMVLYHFNFGFPVLDDATVMMTSPGEVRSRDEVAENGLARWREMEAPTDKWPETVFFHRLRADAAGKATSVLFNPRLGSSGLGVYVRYQPRQLPWLVEWKQMGRGDYVIAMEPATHPPVGRDKARLEGGLLPLPPGGSVRFEMEIGVVESETEARELVAG